MNQAESLQSKHDHHSHEGYRGLPPELFPSTLHTINDTKDLIEFSLDHILTIVGAHAGSFFLWDEFQKELVLKSSRGPYRGQKSSPNIKLREGILGLVGQSGKSVLVEDIKEDGRFNSIKSEGRYRSGSFISIPLIAHNKLVGVINLTERQDLNPFSQDDLGRAQQFANHIAVAFENSRHIARLQKENENLHHRVHVLSDTIKKQEPLYSVGKLSANLTHELNNPLDAIRRYVNLAYDHSADEVTREYLSKVKLGIRRAIRVIRGLLQYSRDLHHTELRSVDIHTLVHESIDIISQDPIFDKIKFEHNLGTQRIYVRDAGLPLVLKNIYRNAAQAMKGEGEIRISSRLEGHDIQLIIEDSGPGIAVGILPRVFEPFVSSKTSEDGTGIGLALCREIVEKCGGVIYCENIGERNGARFYINLPWLQR